MTTVHSTSLFRRLLAGSVCLVMLSSYEGSIGFCMAAHDHIPAAGNHIKDRHHEYSAHGTCSHADANHKCCQEPHGRHDDCVQMPVLLDDCARTDVSMATAAMPTCLSAQIDTDLFRTSGPSRYDGSPDLGTIATVVLIV